jgi:hypothetical protein
MAHNGGRSQGQPWFYSQDYIYKNYVRGCENYRDPNNGWRAARPDQVTVAGYPKVPLILSARFAPASARPGRHVLKWTGTASMSFEGFNSSNYIIHSGSMVATNGRVEVSFTSAATEGVQLRVNPTSPVVSPITSIVMCHIDDETAVAAGDIWSDKFIAKLEEVRFGVWRNLDWSAAGRFIAPKWEHRKPQSYALWGQVEHREAIYAGVTTNVGNTFTVPAYSGFVLEDKAMAERWRFWTGRDEVDGDQSPNRDTEIQSGLYVHPDVRL